MNIVFLDAQTMGEIPNLKQLDGLGNYTSYPLTLSHQRIERVVEADIVITCKVIIDKELIDSSPRLKLICVAATGTNNVDVEYARAKGIEVKNVTEYSTESVAQCTVGIILALTNKILYYDNFVKSGNYSRSEMFTHYGPAFSELKGKTLGIIGLGNIGRRVAEVLTAFGMEIVYHSVSGENLNAPYKHLDLVSLLKFSDVISVHCPLTPFTLNLINAQNLSFLKPWAILVNMARGGIINEKDVLNALNNGELGGFGTDVFEKEPMSADNPLLKVKNPERVVLTPHIAWTSLEARTLLIDKLITNISEFVNRFK